MNTVAGIFATCHGVASTHNIKSGVRSDVVSTAVSDDHHNMLENSGHSRNWGVPFALSLPSSNHLTAPRFMPAQRSRPGTWVMSNFASGAHGAAIYFPIDGFRGFCTCLWFHCTPRYHVSHVYDRSQIVFYTFDLMITTPSL